MCTDLFWLEMFLLVWPIDYILSVLIKVSSVEVWSETMSCLGGSPVLVVMGGDSCSKGSGVESPHRMLDGHEFFSCWFVVRIVMFVWKERK